MTDAAISKTKKARGRAKAQLTRAHNWIKAFDSENQLIEGVEVRLAAIEQAWLDFIKNQGELENLDPEAENDGEQEAFESEYYAACAKAKALIATRRRNEQNQNIDEAINVARNEQTRNAGNSISQIKLPPINLPTFNGSYDEWPSFRDTFKAVIDENNALSDIKRLYYLRLALKGIAADVIASITMSADNYRTAWNLLEGRFENKRVLVHHHIQTLLDIPEIQKESHSSLRLLLDTTEKHVRSLKKLDQPTDQWSTILVHLLSAKLDSTTKRAWENKTSSKEVATYEQFIEFLTSRCIMLETLQLDNLKAGKSNIHSNQSKVNTSKRAISAAVTEARTNKCGICKDGNHQIYHCPTFLNLPPQARIKEVQKLKVCLNCFKGGHKLEACVYGTCRLCTRKHNTLLHCNKQPDSSKSDNAGHSKDSLENSQSNESIQTLTHCAMRTQERGLLATAIIKIQNSKGESFECRAFLDPGSQTNFMTNDLCKQLHLAQRKNYLPIRGIYGTQTTALTETQATIMSKFNSFKVKLNFSVLPEITANLPLSKIDRDKIKIPETISLADPLFHVPKRIDILLGSAIFWELLCVGQIKLGKNQPIAQKTKLGWIIAGPIGFENYVKPTIVNTGILPLTETIENQLQQFWHIEEGAPFTEPSLNDKICEEDFVQTHRRNLEGRFEVRLPLQGDISQLGSSEDIAIKRLKTIERKFARSRELKQQYEDFMYEYQELDHMTVVTDASEEEDKVINYLPHHAVLKEDSVTTKLRVVFDASCATSSGVALNDIIRVGPTIQQDLFHILLRFRQHQYVITADIQKMYRQILLQEDQRDLQRIVWRQEQNEPITKFRLNTLTYGLASAPFLATRCLLQLAIENQDEYPEASNVIRNDFYIDDLLSGGSDLEAVQKLKEDLTSILNSAGFNLHKWNSNQSSIVKDSSESSTIPMSNEIKTLGIGWNTTSDCLQYKAQVTTKNGRLTKRAVLSAITQIYDPLGLMGPTIVCAKIIMQQLWKLKLGWDESLPIDLHTTWTRYQENIKNISHVSIPRHVICAEPERIEMHGFCDASEAAYGACIYLRSTDKSGQNYARLLCAKSRVAPLKQVTLPRLELCGALLLSKLGESIQQALTIKFDAIHYWSDSTIALAWLKRGPEELQTFVANRVADIQRITHNVQWAHIKSQDNPADVISRGMSPEALKTHKLWWAGPYWLTMDHQDWPAESVPLPEVIPEVKKQTAAFHCMPSNIEWFTRFSSLNRLKRVTAYCLRFRVNALVGQSRKTGPLSVEELENATATLVRMVQSDEFSSELSELQSNKEVNKRSKIASLNPFLDSKQIIRVGGRLRHADIEYSRRYPIVLPAKHPFTELVIRDAHLKQLHTGPRYSCTYTTVVLDPFRETGG